MQCMHVIMRSKIESCQVVIKVGRQHNDDDTVDNKHEFEMKLKEFKKTKALKS